MTLDAITEQFKALAGKAPSIGKTLKFAFDEGTVFVDLSGDTPSVSNEDKDADCTIITSLETLMKLRSGDLNPMMAVMSGKVKIKGDMGVAMKLQSLFS
ncbi:MAG TPA: SCP2 sterol-binding domain-containing protein [Haliscomenobacter sp.]|uniref:SCP2 sterol-binding domain-containing protein n=1 Tax=Haliscomenobacter sp. TaxID=2717303 RepID=UPI001DD3D456|nr:SCP2 sterol-binding domain-containing protein [Haliscomenobacter sp.]MBK9492846.1 SCP2 sterol-binding domain-containing protein [Haliscomenobacter sp.]HOY15760.1 SCP2 sterol-binding domain-containing protein [Haliscomenobacter sp.]HPH19392.1 SCP2 sterol-binding domain-containing protein [Haliscomenobacter sp.]